ncbi:MAG: histidine kinase [Clostridia bacterium]|nr:histidine kinase [Clostridia bacterium]
MPEETRGNRPAAAREAPRQGTGPAGTRPLSLKRSVFLRMLLITLAAVTAFYLLGVTINEIGIRNVRNDMRSALETHVRYAADQLNQEEERLKFLMLEMLSDRQLMRFAITHEIMTDWERLSHIRTLAAQEYQFKRSSSLLDSVLIMFPALGKTITTEQTQYIDLDETVWQALEPATERGRVTVTEWNGRIWLLLPRYDGLRPMFMIAFSISPEALSAALERLSNDQTQDLALVRKDGTVLAACGRGAEVFGGGAGPEHAAPAEKNRLTAETGPVFGSLTLTGLTLIDEALAPFVTYRTMLWALSLLALILLVVYLLFYRRQILRPINQLVRSMRRVEQDTRYRIESSGLSDYDDDLYVQFNHMIDHIETLAAQLYEEKYRAQKAELKQLQMQIDPHFLYNTLYMIYRIAQSEGNRSIAKLSLNLSNYYRYITKMPEQIVPLRDEIRHVTNYLEIQRIRFTPRIRVEISELPEEIAGEMIPSLIIQPIVENAFQHGVKDLERDGLVSLGYEVEPSLFRVIVSDNSGKMTEESVRKLWAQVTDPESPDSSALCNLYRRLKLYEHIENALELRCANNGLTAVLTFVRKEEKHADAADCG